MGACVSRTEARILIIGLDQSGKTSLLYKLRLGEMVSTVPTIGFNVENLHHENVDFTAWDVGGQARVRPLWRHYYGNTQAIVFVLDSSDSDERFEEAGSELRRILVDTPDLEGVPLLVLANKQDLPGARTVPEVEAILRLGEWTSGRACRVVATSVVTGEGLREGLDWLAMAVKKAGGNTNYS